MALCLIERINNSIVRNESAGRNLNFVSDYKHSSVNTRGKPFCGDIVDYIQE